MIDHNNGFKWQEGGITGSPFLRLDGRGVRLDRKGMILYKFSVC
jgi:hypothetical protein